MIIKSERLELVLLSPPQLKFWIENISLLEKELNVSYRAEPIEGFFIEMLKKQLITAQKDPGNFMWYSFWFLVRKSDRVVVGSACFKNVPTENREVEIGYGLGKEFEHNGYMTEAIKAMCDWALRQDCVSSVIAETDLEGFASQKILERCNFKKYKQSDTLWWRL